jgi:hypothetical protein
MRTEDQLQACSHLDLPALDRDFALMAARCQDERLCNVTAPSGAETLYSHFSVAG